MSSIDATIPGTPIALPKPGAASTLPSQRTGPAKRAIYAGAGVMCVGLGALGVLVPGLPTTVFLIIASWCFARSCPWLTDRLIHNRFFGPFVRYLEPGAVMPRRAKAISLALMWLAITGSCAWVVLSGAPWFVPGTIILAGVGGSWFIVRQGRDSARIDETGARTARHAVGRRRPAHINGACTKPTAPPSNTH